MLINEKTSSEKSFLKGSLALAVSVVIVKILGFVYKLPLSYLLGDEGMGYFNSAYTIFAFFYMISSAGIPKAISIMIGECGGKDVSAERKILGTAFKMFSLIGLGHLSTRPLASTKPKPVISLTTLITAVLASPNELKITDTEVGP